MAGDYSGNAAFLRSLTDGLTPDPLMTVAEWADTYRILSGRAAAEAGKYRTSRTPYMREIMENLSPSSPVERIVFMKAAQTGATEAGNNFIGFVIHQAPGPILAVQPTVELAKRNSQQRIDPLIDDSEALRKIVAPARSRDSGNTVLAKRFPGGQLVLTGANSATGLRSMPARYVFLDEVDAYPGDVDGEGDPIALAEARTATFGHRKKLFLVSTPTIKGLSRIEREYEASDQRRFFVPCPHCGKMQWLQFERLRWEKRKPETAHYLCEACDGQIFESAKTEMLAQGEWRATADGSDPRTRGYHLSALYSPVGWTSWAGIARSWEDAQANDAALKTAKNVLLGETWMESGEAPDWQRLYDRRERWTPGTVPEKALFLTAGADVQKDRIEIDVWGWGRGLESWLIDHIVIEGGPDRPAAWADLTALCARSWRHASGTQMRIVRMGVDTGYEAPAVYGWARSQGFDQVAPLKGVDGFNRLSPVSGPTYVDMTAGGKRIRRGVRLWTVAVSSFKSETYRFLRLERPTDQEIASGTTHPPGTIHLPGWAESEWCKQFVAEQLVTVKTKRGFQRLEWQKLRERNEALDCRSYARAAAWIAGIDRWGEDRWEALETELRDGAGVSRSSERTPSRKQNTRPVSGARDGNWIGRRRGWIK
jgi:phage terminase large subunit GpA-like protein